MKKYLVLAPILVFNVKIDGKTKEYNLIHGNTVDLPETDIAVRALLARNQIKEVENKVKTSKK
ncbi:hypothetical protein AGMMS49525_16970 [Bacteroidia bacterium]|nr:hypothetical protein AGMMS49525_16970 [Bacteroidia bacterium]